MGEGKAVITLVIFIFVIIFGFVSLVKKVGDNIYDTKMSWENSYLEKIGTMYIGAVNGTNQCYTVLDYENLLNKVIEFVNPQVRFNDKNINNKLITNMYQVSVDNNVRNKCPFIHDKNYKPNDILFSIMRILKEYRGNS